MIVVDANVIIYLVFETSFTPMARDVYARDSDWVVPELWEAEVLNGLMNEVKARHLTLDGAVRAATMAADLLTGKVHRCDRTRVLEIANHAHLTAYDAYYVALARSMGAMLVTEDGAIQRTCPDVARSLKGFLGESEGPAVVRERSATYRVRKRRLST